jgi:restriction endonuclease S subunit
MPTARTPLPEGDIVRILQASDVRRGGSIDWDRLPAKQFAVSMARYMVREGDVLLPLRSVRFSAVVARRVPANVIASGHWALLTPDAQTIDADFLAWYLNHSSTSARLGRLVQGSKIQFLSISTLRDFEIELPPLPTQLQITRVQALHLRVRELEQQLTDCRTQLIEALTMALLQRAMDTCLKDS